MKILQINNFHYRRGGSEVVYFNTTKLLEKNGHKVAHFSMKSRKNIDSPYSNYFIDFPNYFDSSFVKRLFDAPKYFFLNEAKNNLELLVKNFKPDIAHTHLIYGGITSSILPILKKYKIPLIFTIHDYKLLCPVYTFIDNNSKICEKCLKNSYFNCVINRCNRGSSPVSLITALECLFRDKCFPPEKYVSKFINVSKFSLNKHLEKNDWNGKMTHLYNFMPNLKEIPRSKKIGTYFLFLGRLSREKGTVTLVNAWSKVNASTKLKIVGTGPLATELNKKIKINKIENIELIGYKSGKELVELIQNAKFIIVPSEWYENNPMNVIEAYAYGKPVIASNIGGLPEIVIENKTGFLFEPGNEEKLAEIIKNANAINESVYIKMAYNARNFAEKHFSEEKHYHKLLTIYNEALKKYNK